MKQHLPDGMNGVTGAAAVQAAGKDAQEEHKQTSLCSFFMLFSSYPSGVHPSATFCPEHSGNLKVPPPYVPPPVTRQN